MKHLGYSAMLIFTFFGSIWLEVFFKLKVFSNLVRLFLSIFPFALLYLTWDLFAVRFEDWKFDSSQVIGVKFISLLPIEEILFFIIVPVAAILTLEAAFHKKAHWKITS